MLLLSICLLPVTLANHVLRVCILRLRHSSHKIAAGVHLCDNLLGLGLHLALLLAVPCPRLALLLCLELLPLLPLLLLLGCRRHHLLRSCVPLHLLLRVLLVLLVLPLLLGSHGCLLVVLLLLSWLSLQLLLLYVC